MGVIQRQGIKNTIVNYVAVGIGAISTIFIYPRNLEFYGLAQYLFSMATLLVPFASLGVVSTTLKFFPEFRDEKRQHNGMLFTLLLFASIAFIVVVSLAYAFKNSIYSILDKLAFRIDIIQDYGFLIIGLTYLLILMGIFISWASNFKRIVVPAVLNNLFIRIALPVLIILSLYQLLDIKQFASSYVICYVLITISLILYVAYLKQLRLKASFSFLSMQRLKRMASYSLYSGLSRIGTVLAFRLDIIMVSMLLGVKTAGAYGIFLFLANTLAIPTRAINNVSAPIIAKYWEENNINEIKILYQKSSEQLLLFGAFLFVLIYCSLGDIIDLTQSDGALDSKDMVFIFLGLANIVDMVTSVNTSIIIYSNKYRYNLLFVGILAISNIFLNYFLIKNYFLETDASIGAALASFISIAMFNIIKGLYIWFTFKMQPFSKNSLITAALAGVVILLMSFVNVPLNPFTNILINSVLVSILYIPILYYLNIGSDLWQMLSKYVPFFKKKI